MESINQDSSGSYSNTDQFVFTIGNEPIMNNAIKVIDILEKQTKVILRAKGNSIPNAVAIANIITENMLSKILEIQKITLDSESRIDSSMLSIIEIILAKK